MTGSTTGLCHGCAWQLVCSLRWIIGLVRTHQEELVAKAREKILEYILMLLCAAVQVVVMRAMRRCAPCLYARLFAGNRTILV